MHKPVTCFLIACSVSMMVCTVSPQCLFYTKWPGSAKAVRKDLPVVQMTT